MDDRLDEAITELHRCMSENMWMEAEEYAPDPERAKLEAGSDGLNAFQSRVYKVLRAWEERKALEPKGEQSNG